MHDSGIQLDMILMIAARAITFMLVIPIHESAHGLVALWLGDDTAKRNGRISLSPFAHIDIIGLLMMLALGVGYAKPVPVDPSKFKRRRLGYAIVAIAGPISNLLAALVGYFIYVLSACIIAGGSEWTMVEGMVSETGKAAYELLGNFIHINVALALFNLIPLPPMDGFNFLRAFTPAKFDNWVFRNQRVLSGIFFALIIIGSNFMMVRVVFMIIEAYVEYGVFWLVSWIPLLFR
ncbi:site-2 protease family protein [uncultured Ruminococcus sp.]|uniref:site-2 protease family protein n=1 Tax=uncultured Ruminococcus sp. TaxID=165186 RepID=UPI0026274135|nr:site-2 protease family protein [uncultured Ruminococcus sp.]